MDTHQIETILRDQERATAGRLASEKEIPREAASACAPFLERPRVLAITGPRRAGKTVLSRQLAAEKPHVCVSFDDERLAGIRARELNLVLETAYRLYGSVDRIVLDEIHNVPGWERFASRLAQSKSVIVTGSNASLLSGELATFLTGRHSRISLYPFSFREYLRLQDFDLRERTTESLAKLKGHLEAYLERGGFPEAQRLGASFLRDLYDDVLHRDILARHGLRYARPFREMARYLVANSGAEITYRKLGNAFGIRDPHTVREYAGYLEDAFLVVELERYSPKLKERFRAPRKAYAVDTGLTEAVVPLPSPNRGRRIEHAVLLELVRRRATDPTLEVFYWRDYRQSEVDFVVVRSGRVRQLIQVTYAMDDPLVREREIKALLKASSELRCRDLVVITWETEGAPDPDVRQVPFWRWLSEPEPAS